MAKLFLTSDVKSWINRLASWLDPRVDFQLLPLMAGLLFATGRRTVSSWLRAGRLSKHYQDYYYFLSSLGRKVKWLAGEVLEIAVEAIAPNGRIVLAIDDTPSKRMGLTRIIHRSGQISEGSVGQEWDAGSFRVYAALRKKAPLPPWGGEELSSCWEVMRRRSSE